jgi:uncharacterized membrane protein HdeD (DUF308 family)
MLLHALARNWWMVLLRGLLAIAFALVAFFLPGATLVALVIVFGAWAFVDGAFALGSAILGQNHDNRWLLVLEGIVGIAAGLVTWFYPGITALTLVFFIAWWAIITGILEVVYAIQLRKAIKNEWLYIVAGVASVIFGILVILNPGAGALSILWIIGIYALIFGILLVGLSLRLRSHATEAQPAAT